MVTSIDAVSRAWREVLQVDNLAESSNFFELGGDSVLGMMVVFSVSETLGVDLPPEVLFEAPTLQAFAEAVERARTASVVDA